MDFRKLMEEASKTASRETMTKWGDFLCKLMDHLKESHHEIYEEYYIEFYEMNYGEHLNEHLAKKWVDSMKSANGNGEHFSKTDADNYAKQIGLTFNGSCSCGYKRTSAVPHRQDSHSRPVHELSSCVHCR